MISVQVLSEFTSVARRKLAFSCDEVDEVVGAIREVCHVEPLTVDTYESARRLADRHRLPWDDAMIAASALRAGCKRLFSEDFQHRQVLDRQLELVNPFL